MTASSFITTMSSSISAVLGDFGRQVVGLFEIMDWAEEEIDSACKRHVVNTDTLWHSFTLLVPRHELMSTEFVYRSHAVEILERVAAGEDTRPATASEMCCVLAESSQITPLTSAASGLYCRMWQRAFPAQPLFWESHEAHEALEGTRIDELEALTRRKASSPDRTLAEIVCSGQHQGEAVDCKYASRQEGGQLGLAS